MVGKDFTEPTEGYKTDLRTHKTSGSMNFCDVPFKDT